MYYVYHVFVTLLARVFTVQFNVLYATVNGQLG